MGGGAWPFLVGGAICLVNSVNERDLGLLNSHANLSAPKRIRFGGGSLRGEGSSLSSGGPFGSPSGEVRSGAS